MFFIVENNTNLNYVVLKLKDLFKCRRTPWQKTVVLPYFIAHFWITFLRSKKTILYMRGLISDHNYLYFIISTVVLQAFDRIRTPTSGSTAEASLAYFNHKIFTILSLVYMESMGPRMEPWVRSLLTQTDSIFLPLRYTLAAFCYSDGVSSNVYCCS